MSRIAVLSDIHGNLPALEAVIADAEARGCSAFLNLGDCVSGPLWPAETADLLIARDWPTIAGNHERQLLGPGAMSASDAFAAARLSDRHRTWIAALPPTLAVGDLALCHGTPVSDVEHLLFSVDAGCLHPAGDDDVIDRAGAVDRRILLCGHTHIATVRILTNGLVAANPGSVGLQAFTDDRPADYVVANGDPRARYAVIEDGEIRLIAIDYDHRAAAAKATAEGFDDWSAWLASGRVTA